MTNYRFWQVYSDPTPYATPTRADIVAEHYSEAIKRFCNAYGFQLEDIDKDHVWVDSQGASIEYFVNW
ncbi:hypothetical protein [Alicyclobacillus ferrooxydans]|uniref:Uncharacterized protein n=1 Tax=Alicyclobacillus ferrooxydans TaxID=471514 RepID=A0A0P9CG36_9BACL|nr:hypothetical protein [Alicyclobacillus ferrooxydans]KPV41984.1 hypothetical protein AN477_19620 [Alicyclobacillus ferrooxydans]